MIFPVVMHRCESWTHEEGRAPKNWCFRIVMLEKTLESPLDSKEIKPVNSKKSPLNIHWKDCCWNWSSNTLATWCEELTQWKRPWCWERLKAGGEGDDRDEMAGWHHWHSGHGFEQAPGDTEGQGGLACCGSCSRSQTYLATKQPQQLPQHN